MESKFAQKKTTDGIPIFILNADFPRRLNIPNSDVLLNSTKGKTGVHALSKNIDYRRDRFSRLKILEKDQVLLNFSSL
ncbi:MAG: hypothetical protein KAW47_05205, partial [Thermoplasmatales archaeon]|nr:hypothetical protein [Thermoplasmatales archaeon]